MAVINFYTNDYSVSIIFLHAAITGHCTSSLCLFRNVATVFDRGAAIHSKHLKTDFSQGSSHLLKYLKTHMHITYVNEKQTFLKQTNIRQV